jgi:hypothetical protein
VTSTFPLPSMTWVPERTIGSVFTLLSTCDHQSARDLLFLKSFLFI